MSVNEIIRSHGSDEINHNHVTVMNRYDHPSVTKEYYIQVIGMNRYDSTSMMNELYARDRDESFIST